jgi:hypothetical protein
MGDRISALRAALRVLRAVREGAIPAPNDIEELQELAPECSDLRADDLACKVIWQGVHTPAVSRIGENPSTIA